MVQPSLIDMPGYLTAPFSASIRQSNPHWWGLPGVPVQSFRRTLFGKAYRLLRNGMAPAVVLRGPRRVGKTVLLRQVLEALIADGVPANHICYVPFDDIGSMRRLADPILSVARWFESEHLGQTFNEAARSGNPAYLPAGRSSKPRFLGAAGQESGG